MRPEIREKGKARRGGRVAENSEGKQMEEYCLRPQRKEESSDAPGRKITPAKTVLPGWGETTPGHEKKKYFAFAPEFNETKLSIAKVL